MSFLGVSGLGSGSWLESKCVSLGEPFLVGELLVNFSLQHEGLIEDEAEDDDDEPEGGGGGGNVAEGEGGLSLSWLISKSSFSSCSSFGQKSKALERVNFALFDLSR